MPSIISTKVCISSIRFDAPPMQEPLSAPLMQLPHFSKNRRRNTSGMVRFMHSDGRMRNVVIDCGKTFYDSALSWFVEYRLRHIDAVILTHGHADAMMGLDDLRQWTIGNEERRIQKKVDVYPNAETMRLFLELEHGRNGNEPYMSLGFRFEDLTYISDANAIPPRAACIIHGSTHLVIDGLGVVPHSSHFSFDQAVQECILALARGGNGYFTGLSHSMDHDELNVYLASQQAIKDAGIHIEAGFDGQRIQIQS
ncbi:hypothetical protein BSLG_005118 [Batrachochytrium salamandrivorans]|nr:hypothetical protein BSLG_005118 [Batrachochytrium salamandrivorans]